MSQSRARPLGKYFSIRSRLKTELVLEVQDGIDKPGAAVVLNEEAAVGGGGVGASTTSTGDHQLWYFDAETQAIRSKLNRFCLDIDSKGSRLVVQPHLRDCSTQKWVFFEDLIQTEDDFELVVTITEARLHSPAKVMATEPGNLGQRWSFDCKPASFFHIRSQDSAKVLEVRKADPKPGARVIVNEDKGEAAEHQLWYEDQQGIIRSKLNSFALDSSGKEVVLLPYEKSKDCQLWTVNNNSLQNRANRRQVLEMKPGKFRSDASVFVAEHAIFNPMQFWSIEHIHESSTANHSGIGKHFIVRSRLSGLILQSKDRSASPGALVVTGYRDNSASSGPSQLFFLDEITGTIRTSVNNYCLDLREDDSCLVLNPYDPYRKTQQWRIQGAKIFCRQQSDQVLTLDSGGNDPERTVSSQKDQSSENQLWEISHQPAKCFYIISQMNGRVLDVKGNDHSPGVKVIMYDRKPEVASNQLWYEDENGILRSKLTGFILEANTEKTESVRMKSFSPTNKNHHWVIVGDRIQNKYDNSTVLDIHRESKKNGASLCAYKFTGGENQRWTFEYV